MARPAAHDRLHRLYRRGAAFFDGREPYDVTNIRGWKYLYPPRSRCLFCRFAVDMAGGGLFTLIADGLRMLLRPALIDAFNRPTRDSRR